LGEVWVSSRDMWAKSSHTLVMENRNKLSVREHTNGFAKYVCESSIYLVVLSGFCILTAVAH